MSDLVPEPSSDRLEDSLELVQPLNGRSSGSLDTKPHPAADDARRSPKPQEDDVHQYLEHIDALHSKLKYLTQDAAATARRVVEETEDGSFDQRLAEKDERIARDTGSVAELEAHLSAERARTTQLEKRISTLETSKTLSEDRHHEQLRESQAAADRERERARLIELDLRRELQV